MATYANHTAAVFAFVAGMVDAEGEWAEHPSAQKLCRKAAAAAEGGDLKFANMLLNDGLVLLGGPLADRDTETALDAAMGFDTALEEACEAYDAIDDDAGDDKTAAARAAIIEAAGNASTKAREAARAAYGWDALRG